MAGRYWGPPAVEKPIIYPARVIDILDTTVPVPSNNVTVHVGTSLTENYYPIAEKYGYFNGLSKLNGVRKFAVLFDVSDEFVEMIRAKYPSIEFIVTKRSDYRCQEQLEILPSLQHGEFLDKVPGISGGDYVIFTDADITIQRQFTQREMDAFCMHNDKVLIAPDVSTTQTLEHELLMFGGDPTKFNKIFGEDASSMYCYNCGVIGASPKEWKRICNFVIKSHEDFQKVVKSRASVQPLISYALQRCKFALFGHGLDFVLNIHSHAHHPDAVRDFKIKRHMRGGIIRNDKLVMFAHAHLFPMTQEALGSFLP